MVNPLMGTMLGVTALERSKKELNGMFKHCGIDPFSFPIGDLWTRRNDRGGGGREWETIQRATTIPATKEKKPALLEVFSTPVSVSEHNSAGIGLHQLARVLEHLR